MGDYTYNITGTGASNFSISGTTLTIAAGTNADMTLYAVWEANPVAFAVYSETDSSLRFYNNTDTVSVGDTYNGLVATNVYTKIETSEYYQETNVPWYDLRASITNVVVEDVISPISTSYWFYGMMCVTGFDLSNLNTSNVTNMSYMFLKAGYSSTNWFLNLSEWNVNKVTSYSGFNDGVTDKITPPVWVN